MVFVALMPTSISLDNRPEMFRNTPHFRILAVRDYSTHALAASPKPQIKHLVAPSLPVVPDKPTPARARVVAKKVANNSKYPRLAVVIGVGRYRNQYGASCVPFVQAKGYHIYGAKYAINWPSAARAAGYRVDHVPEIGAAIVTRESSAGTSTGHVAIQLSKPENGYVYVAEQNYQAGMETRGWVRISNIVAFIHQT